MHADAIHIAQEWTELGVMNHVPVFSLGEREFGEGLGTDAFLEGLI
jgi:hypothetical protein